MARLGSWDIGGVDAGWFDVDALASGWADRDYIPDPTLTTGGGWYQWGHPWGGLARKKDPPVRRRITPADLAREQELAEAERAEVEAAIARASKVERYASFHDPRPAEVSVRPRAPRLVACPQVISSTAVTASGTPAAIRAVATTSRSDSAASATPAIMGAARGHTDAHGSAQGGRQRRPASTLALRFVEDSSGALAQLTGSSVNLTAAATSSPPAVPEVLRSPTSATRSDSISAGTAGRLRASQSSLHLDAVAEATPGVHRMLPPSTARADSGASGRPGALRAASSTSSLTSQATAIPGVLRAARSTSRMDSATASTPGLLRGAPTTSRTDSAGFGSPAMLRAARAVSRADAKASAMPGIFQVITFPRLPDPVVMLPDPVLPAPPLHLDAVRHDPVHEVPGGYRWGRTGKTYKTKTAAERQARAIYASGWRENARAIATTPVRMTRDGFMLANLGPYPRRLDAEVARETMALVAKSDSSRMARVKLQRMLTVPKAIEQRFVNELVALLGVVHTHIQRLVIPRLLQDEPVVRHASGDWVHHDAKPAKASAAPKAKPVSPSARIAAVGGMTGAAKLLGSLDDHLRKGGGIAFDRMATAVNKKTGQQIASLIPITPKSAGIEDFVEQSRNAALDYLVDAGRDYADDVRDVLTDPDNFEKPARDLARLVEERAGVSKSHAMLIARDQTLKLHAGIMKLRHQAAGVERYRWSTSMDERVRPMHADLEGQEFSYDDPPETNKDGDTNNPGEDFQCRCVAIPIIGEDEDEEEETEEPEETEETTDEPVTEPDDEEDEDEDTADRADDGDWDESKHPRDPSGRFGSGSGKSSEAKPEATKPVAWQSTKVEKDALMTLDQISAGITHPGLREWLSKPENQPTIHVTKDFEGTDGWGKAGTIGEYRYDAQAHLTGREAEGNSHVKPEVEISTNVEIPVGAQAKVPDARDLSGENWGVHSTANSREQEVQYAFLHELGHHVHRYNEEGIKGQPTTMGNDTQVMHAWRALGRQYGETDGPPEMARAQILDGLSPSPTVSRYAMSSPREYFAECFAAYMTKPDQLKKIDADGYRMVRNVLQNRGIEKDDFTTK